MFVFTFIKLAWPTLTSCPSLESLRFLASSASPRALTSQYSPAHSARSTQPAARITLRRSKAYLQQNTNTMPPNASTASKMYSADVVAAVLMATGTMSLSMKHYEIMSCLDGVKTASAFQHDFRSVLAKAKELKARIDKGETFEPVAPSTKRGTYC